MSDAIKKKIDTLIKLSNIGWEDMDELQTKMTMQDQLFDELGKMAKEENTLLGTLLQVPMADGYAMYIIDKVNKSTFHVTWLDYCDAWVDSRWGHGCNIAKSQARMFMRW